MKKKFNIIISFLLVVVTIFAISACSKGTQYKDTVVTVTDESGKAVTDKDGKVVTEIVKEDKNGNTSGTKESVTDEDGNKTNNGTTAKDGSDSKATTKKSSSKTTAKATTKKAEMYSIKVVVTLPKIQEKDKKGEYQYVEDTLTITDANNKDKVLATRKVKLNGKTTEFSIKGLSGMVNVTASLKNLKAKENEVIKKSKTVKLKLADPDTTKSTGIEVMDGGID